MGAFTLVRQALYGQRYLRERFGITATTGANVDSFGHNGSIPQLLRGAGMDSYVFLRPGPHERELPASLFRWESLAREAYATAPRVLSGPGTERVWLPAGGTVRLAAHCRVAGPFRHIRPNVRS